MHRFHGNQLHVFWHNSDHTRINHEVITVSIDGTLPERGPTDSRVFRDNPRYPMTTACSAGPYVGFDTPLFLACGYTAFGGSTFYGVPAYPGEDGERGAPLEFPGKMQEAEQVYRRWA